MVLHEHDVDAESWDDVTRGTLTFRTLFGGPASRIGSSPPVSRTWGQVSGWARDVLFRLKLAKTGWAALSAR
jgi:hypothetical protein